MSGPPYPHPNPAPGSNAIGSYKIGVSPLGDIPPFDIYNTLMAQYANSSTLLAFITSFNAAMDMTANLDAFYDNMWNILTAQGYGLDVWGRIIGVVRTISIPGTVQFFGFEEAGTSWTGFGQGGFASPGSGFTQNFTLNDADFRRFVMAKAAANICNGSIPAMNAILLALFPGRGTCYVADGLNMSLAFTFRFALAPQEVAIVAQLGVFLAGAGVAVSVAQV